MKKVITCLLPLALFSNTVLADVATLGPTDDNLFLGGLILTALALIAIIIILLKKTKK